MAEVKRERINDILKLAPRRFQISRTPPFAPPYDFNLVLCGQVNDEEEDGSPFVLQRDGIRNCKPGIWTSRRLPVTKTSGSDGSDTEDEAEDEGYEALLYWVAEGEIPMTQSIEDWKEYEEKTRESDAEVKLDGLFPPGTKWRRCGSYFDDGGVCSVISTDYLSRTAANHIMGYEDFDLGFYFEMITIHGFDEACSRREFSSLTLGGMNFPQDPVGCPPRVATVEENGQVVAVRLYAGFSDEDIDEDGFVEEFELGREASN